MTSAWDDPRSRRHVASLHRLARWAALASALLVVLLALLAWRATARADRLAVEGVEAQAVVVDRYAHGKSYFVTLRYAGREVPLRVGNSWTDPYDGYVPGQVVTVRHDRRDVADVRTAATWNTPGQLVLSGVLASGLLVTAVVAGAVTAGHARRLRRRLQAGTWVPVVVARDGAVEGTGVALTAHWPVPREVLRLVPRQGRTEVLLVEDRVVALPPQARSRTDAAASAGGGTGA